MDKSRTLLRVASAWSGGKDSCFAFFKARQAGYKVEYLYNIIGRDNLFRGELYKNFIKMQAASLNLPLMQKEIFFTQRHYPINFREELRGVLCELAERGVKGLIFGYSLPGRQSLLMRKLCAEFNMKLIEPLLNKNDKALLKEIVGSGFKQIVSEIDTNFFDLHWLGRVIDEEFIEYLDRRLKFENRRKINLLGDSGIYHTLVIDGPVFRKKMLIQETKQLIQGSRAWLNILKCKLVNKKMLVKDKINKGRLI